MSNKTIKQAVILAGGKGTRLRPLTYKIPKSMIPVGNKPFLEHQINLLRRFDINDIVLCIGHLGDKIYNYFKDGSDFGVIIRYSVEKKPLDTGGALKNAENELNSSFLVLYGDTYLPIDYNNFASCFSKNKKIGLLALYDNSEGIARCNISMNEQNLITKYNKDSPTEDMSYIEAGVSAFEKKLLDYMPHNQNISLERSVYPELIKIKQLMGYKTSQRYYDIGTPERLKLIRRVLR